MAAVARIALNMVARTGKFNRGVRKAGETLKQFRARTRKAKQEMKRLNAALVRTAKVGLVAVTAGFVKAAFAGETFSRAMNKSTAIMGDLDETMRDSLIKTSLEVARVTKFTAAQTAESLFFLASAGLSVEQSLKALPLVAKFAQAGLFDMALATDLLTDAQSALGLTVADATENLKNMRRVADVLVAANTKANASVQQLSESLTNKFAAALKFTGTSLEQGIGLLAAFADQGLKGAEAGTAGAIVLRELQNRFILNTAAFKKFNIEVFRAGKMRDLSVIVGELEAALSKLTPEMKIQALMSLGFQQKSIDFIKILIGTSEKIRDVEQAVLKMGGITETVAKRQMTPFMDLWAELGVVVTETGLGFKGVLDPLAEGLTNIIGRVRTAIDVLGFFVARLQLSGGIVPLFPGEGKREESLGKLAGPQITASTQRALDEQAAAVERLADKGARLAAKRAAVSETNAARAIADATAVETVNNRLAKLATFATDVFEETRSPLEMFHDRIGMLNEAALAGALDADTFARAWIMAGKALDDATGATERLRQEADARADAIINNLRDFSANKEQLAGLQEARATRLAGGTAGLRTVSSAGGAAGVASLIRSQGRQRKSPELEELRKIRNLQEEIARQQRQLGGAL